MSEDRIAAVADVPDDGTYLFRIEAHGAGVEREAILVQTDDGVAGWLNYCQHFTHVRLDEGEGAPLRNGEVLCTNHGAMFEVGTGLCTHGPCEGAYLNELDLRIEGGVVHLDDPDYAYVGPGSIPREEGDLTATTNVEF